MNNDINYKKLLIISHNCLSTNGSNGRTLLNYLQGWPKEKISQLYIHYEAPNFELCNRFFCLTDKAVLKSIIKRNPAGSIVEKQEHEEQTTQTVAKKRKKNSLIFSLRIMAWKSRLWNAKRLNNWVDEFNPEIVLVQAGDFGPLFDIAVSISKKYNAKLVVYNTEGYYFKKESYFQEEKPYKLLYKLVLKYYINSYNKLINKSDAQIYNCDLLKQDYDKALGTNSKVIMNSSQFTNFELDKDKDESSVIYAGNLGLFRYKGIIEFANALAAVKPNMYVDVYGKFSDEDCENEIKNCPNIRFHGFIAYEELKVKLQKSKFLLHVESFDEFYKEDLKYAFSTKIADSLATGSCLFVYAPKNMAVCQYLKDTNAAVLINDKKDLQKSIFDVLENEAMQSTYMTNARMLALKNHNLDTNKNEFQSIMCQ